MAVPNFRCWCVSEESGKHSDALLNIKYVFVVVAHIVALLFLRVAVEVSHPHAAEIR